MGGSSGVTSAKGVISLLDEEQIEIKEHALTKLNELVDEFWAEIAESIAKM
jgi:26S proteasome regulatory subunit N2